MSADDGPACGFDDAGAYEQTLSAKGWIAHPVSVAFKVLGLIADGFGEFL